MYPRLIILCVVGLSVLTGCKHRASYTEFRGLSSSVASDQHVEVQRPEATPDPLQRLATLVFGPRDASASTDTVEFEDDADSVQYVEPASPSYKTSAYTEVEGETLPPYKLDSGDRIRVFVYGQPNLTRVYNVDGQGRISIPLIGSVLARGRTTRVLEGIIKRSLQREFVKDAKVSIEIAVYRPIYVHGEVRSPGQFPYVYGMTVEAAIATAGGFSPRASKRKIHAARKINGLRDNLSVGLSSYVRPGDIISVDERFF